MVMNIIVLSSRSKGAADGAPDDRRRPLAYEGNPFEGSEKQKSQHIQNKIQLLDRRLNPSA
jgi:hypothetical protein